MKYKIIIIIQLLIYTVSFSQNEDNVWYFGFNGGLDFNQDPPAPINNGQINSYGGCDTICDSSGQLLFYTNGVTVWNRNHQIMLNGTGLSGNIWIDQSVIIIPKPDSNLIYYIFTANPLEEEKGIRFSEVDMSLGNGLGGITSNKNILLHPDVSIGVTAVKKPTCDGFWVITHLHNSDAFLTFDVTSFGVNITPILSRIGALQYITSSGNLKFSPNGKKIAITNSMAGLQLFDFNPVTGKVTNLITEFKRHCRGVAFSPSNDILYTTNDNNSSVNGTPHQISQYDLNANDIEGSEIVLFKDETLNIYCGSLQLAPNGKIYCSIVPYSDDGIDDTDEVMLPIPFLSSIDDPDILGDGCGFIFNSTNIGGRAGFDLPQSIQPQFNNYYIESDGLCTDEPVEFRVYGCPEVLSAFWDFGDGNTSNSTVGQNIYLLPGTYTVSVQFTTSAGSFTRTKIITFIKKPIANPIPNTQTCVETNSPFDLTIFNSYVIGNQNPDNYIISYFLNNNDAENNINPILNQSLIIGTNIFYARIHSVNNSSCFALTSFSIVATEKPILKNSLELIACDIFPYDDVALFDLNTITNQVIENDDPSLFTISYHLTLSDAQNNLNQVNTNYTNNSITQILFVRVENMANQSCYTTQTITLKVVREPIITTITDWNTCEETLPNDGLTRFDLSTKNAEILNGQSPSMFGVNYYLSLSDAQNNSNPLNRFFTNTTNPQIIYVRIFNALAPNCYKTASFNLTVYPKPDFILEDSYFICEENNPITISLPNDFSRYTWSTGSITSTTTVSEPGDYSVTVGQQHENLLCETTKNFTVVESNIATILEIKTIDFNGTDNTITILVDGSGDYEYSLDGIYYQDSNSFTNLKAGEYLVYVRDKNGCGIAQVNTYLLTYPLYFTPNNDGYNDFWNIKFSYFEPNLNVMIFDRYGKFITSFDSNSIGWDGTLNNQKLPADDYWFVVNRENKKEYKGHFSLKR